MDGRKAKLSQFIFMELFFNNAVDLVLSGKITIKFTFGLRQKALPNKTLFR